MNPYTALSDAAWWRGICNVPALRVPSRWPAAWGYLWLALHPVKVARLVPLLRRDAAARPDPQPVRLRRKS